MYALRDVENKEYITLGLEDLLKPIRLKAALWPVI